MNLTKEQSSHLDTLLQANYSDRDELFHDFLWDYPDYLMEEDSGIDWVDEYYSGRWVVFKCVDGRYFKLTYNEHNSMQDRDNWDFFEVRPKPKTVFIYEPMEENK